MKNTFDPDHQNQLAEKFHQLHHTGSPLVLANAWDALSAKIVELEGLPAVATTSSGISWSCGYADGEGIPSEMMIEEVRKIARCVKIPVSADIEGGYCGNDQQALAHFTQNIIKAGAIGVNLEDSDAKTGKLNSVIEQVEKIKTLRKTAQAMGVNLFINARIDAMTLEDGITEKLKIITDRAQAYQQAGASGIFVPFITEMETVKAVKTAIQLPLNILMTKTLDVKALKELNINRISLGGRPSLMAKTQFKKIVDQVQNSEHWDRLFYEGITHPQANKWF